MVNRTASVAFVDYFPDDITEDNFITERHAAFNAPESVVFELVARATGLRPHRKKKVTQGFENEVYSVAADNQSEFIVRIRRFGEVDFAQEAWAIEQCRRAGVPTADVLLVDTVQCGTDKVEAMVTTRLAGQPLENLRSTLGEQQMMGILQQASEILGLIHTVHAGGFYQLHAGKWDFATWDAFMDWLIEGRRKEKDFIVQAGFHEGDVDKMLNMLSHYRKEFPCDQAVLCHGDYLPKHFFVNDELNISGIIDFGRSLGGTPVHDFAFLDFDEGPLELLTPFMVSYPDQRLFDDTFQTRLSLHKLGLQMGHLAYHVRFGDVARIDSVGKRLSKVFNTLGTSIL